MTGEALPFVSLGGNSPIHSPGHALVTTNPAPRARNSFNTHARTSQSTTLLTHFANRLRSDVLRGRGGGF